MFQKYMYTFVTDTAKVQRKLILLFTEIEPDIIWYQYHGFHI